MIEGPLRKMRTELNEPINYYMTFPSVFVSVNNLIGKSISLTHTGFSCMSCVLTNRFLDRVFVSLVFLKCRVQAIG